MTFKVRYQYATYSGVREVSAEDSDHAIAKVRAAVRREGGLTMAYESYRVVENEQCE
jgi:hypothetical protein